MADAPRPSPAAMRGRPDPARRVRPVDWSATGAVLPRGEAPETTTGADSAGVRRERPRTVELPRPVPAPPAGAVHSLSPEDPRPAPRPLRIREELIRTVGPRDLDTDAIVLAFTDPEDAWTADAGTSDHFLRGDLVIQVRRADNTVIGAYSAAYALSVRPEAYEPALDIARDAAGPSARRPRGTRHPTSRRELIDRMEAAGFVITPGSSHGRVSHPDHPGLFVPLASTPSDRRYTRHAVTQIRRVFGIDLRR